MRHVDVCLTPELLNLYEHKGAVVVVVDILRATSCMTTALANGVKAIKPVATLEECEHLQSAGWVGAAERNGEKAPGFELGNSPFSYMNDALQGKKVAMTTTNGTLAIDRASKAKEIVIGSFLNISSLVTYLKEQENDILILCAGWKGKVNLEDTLFAGAVVERLKDDFEVEHDGSLAANALYNIAKEDYNAFLKNSSHARRLGRLNIRKDVEFCLTEDVYDVIPVLNRDRILVKMPVGEPVNK